MGRRTRKRLVNSGLIFCALLFILYLNLGGSSDPTFAWTVINYETTSKTLPEANGKCPGLSDDKPVLVVSRVTTDDDVSWFDGLSAKYHLCIYTNDAPATEATTLQVPANRGNEAMSYLTFMIDNYDTIPETGVVFVHGARRAWHNDARDYDNLALLSALNISSALALTGYHNLRCDWSAGTCDPYASPEVLPPAGLETRLTAMLEPYNKRAVSDAALPGAFVALFSDSNSKAKTKLGSKDHLRAQCCAQFVVSRERIWQHSRNEYIALRQWLLDDGAAPRDDKVAGRILSYLWHVLFLPHDSYAGVLDALAGAVDLDKLNAMACPNAQDCYCRLYGRCGLQTCHTPGSCAGEYVLPADYKVPERYLNG